MEPILFALKKLAKDNKSTPSIQEMSDAFYQAQRRINKEERSRKRKNTAFKFTGAAAITGGGYAAYKKGVGGNLGRKARSKIHSLSEKAGREFGVTAGKATNAAGESYKQTLKGGASRMVDKFRGAGIMKKVLKKVIFRK